MKKLKILIGTLILAAGLAGCSSAYYASSGYANDDLYSLHDKTAIARKQQAKAEAEKAAAQAAVTVPLKPQGNRAQRRAENKHKHKPSAGYPAAQPDKAARRKQLLAELAALENG